MLDLQIKRAEPSDAAALLCLNTAFNGACTTEERIIDSLLGNTQEIVLIAYANGIPAGFLCGQICRCMCYKTPHGSVAELFVDSAYRRKGVAAQLVWEIEALFKQMDISTVDIATSVDNHKAQAFYASRGYAGKTKMIYRKRI